MAPIRSYLAYPLQLRPQRLIVVLSGILLLADAAAAFLPVWRTNVPASLILFTGLTLTTAILIGVIIHALGRQQDATSALLSSEERFKEQMLLLQSTLENMGEGLSVFDRDGRLIAWNAKFLQLLDIPAELAADSTLKDILTFQAARGDFGPVDPAAHVVDRVEWFYAELPIVRERMTPAGRTLQIRRNAMPGGGVVTLYSDITERKAAQEKMEQAWAQAELANHSKGEFLANMSHELRTPLNAIIGFSEIIGAEHLGEMNNPRYLEYCRDIHSSGLHLLSIINDVLDMSKIEAGKLEINERDLFVSPLLTDTVRMMRDRADNQAIELLCRLPNYEIGVFGDERALKQSVLNLVSNAIKFSPNGGRVVIEAEINKDDAVVIGIRDSGIGMSPEDLDRALQPFGQANSSTTRAFGGTGLGLPITKGLVEAHGGKLVIDTAPGKGTLVRIILPPERTRLYGIRPSEATRLSA